MKYLFDVTCQPNRNIIKLEVIDKQGGMPINNIARTVVFEAGIDNDEPDLCQLLNEIIDNMRLTVKEREEAKYESKVLKDYIQNYSNENNSNESNSNKSNSNDTDKLILEECI